MKTKIFILFLLVNIAVAVFAADKVEQADSAYMNEDYTAAIKLYEEAASEEGVSTDLYYNIGNAYYRNGQNGKAILYYSRALKLDPTNEDAMTNLDFVKTKIVDKQDDNLTLTEKVDKNIVTLFTADGWAIVTFISFLLLILCIVGYIFLNAVRYRKISFFMGLILIISTIFCIIYSFKSAKRISSDSSAIIIDESVQLSTSPRVAKDKSEQAYFLHEGTRLEIVDSVRVSTDADNPLWYEVVVDNTHRAWISAKSVEKI